MDGNYQDQSEKDLCIHFIPFVYKRILIKEFSWTCSHFAWPGNEPGSHDFSLAEHSGGSYHILAFPDLTLAAAVR